MKRVLHGASYLLVALLFATDLVLSGCGTSVESTKVSQATADSLARMQSENSQLKKSVSQLDQDKKALNAKVADLTSKLGQSSQQWQDLQDLQARVNQLDSELTVQKQINRDLSAQSADVERASLGGGLGPVTNRAGFMRNYDGGLKLFKSRKYANALAVFSDLSKTGVAPDMTGNAFYWMGECYYAMQKYSDAIKAFQTVLTFPRTFKEGAAYIMIGMSYVHLGDKEQARTAWQDLINKDPKSQYAAKAKQFLQQL